MSSETGRKRLVAAAAVLLAGGGIWLAVLNQPETDTSIASVPEDSEAAAESTPQLAEESTAADDDSAASVETALTEDESTDETAAEPEEVAVEADPEVVEEADEVAEAVEDADVTEEPAEEVVEAPVILPSLDTFRVESDGQAVLAGRAGPGALLDIIVGGEVVERITADAAGSFFTFLDLSPSDTSRSLTVIADPDGDAVEMAQTYFIEPFGVEEPETEIAEAETVPGAVAPVAEEEIAAANEVESTPEPEAVEAEQEPEDIATADVEVAEPEVLAEETAELEAELPETPVADEIEISSVEDDAAVEIETAEASEESALVEDSSVEVAELDVAEELAETEAAVEQSLAEVAEALPEEGTETVEVDVADAEEAQVEVTVEEEIAEATTEETTEPVEAAEAVETVESEEEATVVAEAIEEIFGDALVTEEAVAEEPEIAEAIVEEQAPTVLEVDDTGVRVVASGPGPQALSQVALDTITYDPTGEVLIAGRASTDGFVQVYIDNKPITVSRITRDRNWSTDLPEVDTGIYTLRIDEVDAEGTVVSRLETPFKREEAETVAAVMAEETQEEDFEVAVKTVQPGATLWAIAREQYGQGILYVSVFEANKDLIRDPDLIYPGQIFVLPELEEAEEE